MRASSDASLDFLGAADSVTGSRFLIASGSGKLLVDCGLFQGLRELRQRNWDRFPAAPDTIDAVAISHAHLDHTGYLPALVRDGFTGPILATCYTARLAEVVLQDSAHLLMEDTAYATTHGYSKHAPPRPLYTDEDATAAVRQFRAIDYEEQVKVTDTAAVTLRPAGHILGSATVHVTLPESSILFSGDLGRPLHPLLRPPAPPPESDIIVVESTYGNRKHAAVEASDIFTDAINRTARRGGSIVIPAFAVDRTEVILSTLKRLRKDGAIPDVPIFVDSPMALDALAIYRDAIRQHAPDLREDVELDDDPFDRQNITELRSREQSKSLNDPHWPCIIVSASGMVSGGRVLHHLAGLLPRPENTVLLVGYQAVGTRGRQLLDGARSIKIHGEYVAVRAEIVDVPMFSVHADADEILSWLGQAPHAPQTCYVVHGEPAAAGELQHRICDELGWTAVVPRYGERVRIAGGRHA
ncbi:MAG TPA: MBL fold metallo-hydrolase [Mycobacteriales bacterium]|nr:MBL fold metallo-hydrolase [Mycobacteriales bacterium]